jgi:hypothetical protein
MTVALIATRSTRLVSFLASGIIVGLVIASVASAASFSVGRTGVAAACLGTSVGPQIGSCSIGGDTIVVNSGLAQLDKTYTGSGDTLTAFAAGNAGFGVLSASALASFDITGTATNGYAVGQAVFTDIITTSFAPLNGQPGFMNIFYTLDGLTSSTGNGHGCAQVNLVFGPDTSNTQSRYQHYLSSTSGVFSAGAPLQFIYGQPFGLNFSLATFAGTLQCSGGNTNGSILQPQTGSGSDTANFFNTFVLSGLIPTDVNGTPVIGAQFSSSSGTSYGLDGVVVPEPCTTFLFGCGLGLLVYRHRRTQHQ